MNSANRSSVNISSTDSGTCGDTGIESSVGPQYCAALGVVSLAICSQADRWQTVQDHQHRDDR